MDPKDFIGVTLGNGYRIEQQRVSAAKNPTGACHSMGFSARAPDGRLAFVKILDTSFDKDVDDPLADLKARVDAYFYEREVVFKTAERKMSAIIRAIDHGSISVAPWTAEHPAYYLLFELADGDLREQIDLNKRFDLAYQLRVLHNTARGLNQLHFSHIAHQDLKPSNVVTFDKLPHNGREMTKIADLGHAHDRQLARPGVDRVIAGDPTWAPPEQLYDHRLSDWGSRRLAADLYQLGSLTVFLFLGVGATASIAGHLRPEHHWDVWMGGAYADIQPHLVEATEATLEELAAGIDPLVRDELTSITRYLLDPDPMRRGHPRNRGDGAVPYGLERIISAYAHLAKKAEWALAVKVQQ
jgi:serine/threonine protein kinase